MYRTVTILSVLIISIKMIESSTNHWRFASSTPRRSSHLHMKSHIPLLSRTSLTPPNLESSKRSQFVTSSMTNTIRQVAHVQSTTDEGKASILCYGCDDMNGNPCPKTIDRKTVTTISGAHGWCQV